MRRSILAVGGLALVALTGCDAEPGAGPPPDPSPSVELRLGVGEPSPADRCRSRLAPVPTIRPGEPRDRLSRAGVEGVAELEPAHGRPYRIFGGTVAGREVVVTAVRPGSRLFSGDRVLERIDVPGATVLRTRPCGEGGRAFRARVDDVVWSLSGLPRDEAIDLLAALAAG